VADVTGAYRSGLQSRNDGSASRLARGCNRAPPSRTPKTTLAHASLLTDYTRMTTATLGLPRSREHLEVIEGSTRAPRAGRLMGR
jgi:hypothetical protein